MKKLISLFLAICLIGPYASVSASASNAGYAEIIEEKIEENDENAGILYDMDGDGAKELAILSFSRTTGYFYVSAYTRRNGTVKVLADDEIIDIHAGAAYGWIGAVAYAGKIYFAIYQKNGIQEADDSGRYEYVNYLWRCLDLYSLDSADNPYIIYSTVIRSASYSDGTVDYTGSTFNGESANIAQCESFMSSVSVKVSVEYGQNDLSTLLSAARNEDSKFQSSGSTRFSDVSASDYFADAVNWAVENDITSGTGSATFSPNASCTRAQAVTFLWRAAGSPNVSGGNPFSDVSSSAYYYKAVLWAVRNGITSGTSATKFSPNAACTRAQIITFLHRSAGTPSVSTNNSFNDVNSSQYYYSAVQWAVNNGITNGTGNSTFSPENDCTRAQTVTFLYRCLAK